ncbi:DUF29 domain-containing protein [Nitrospira sp. Kam-Ns4a]
MSGKYQRDFYAWTQEQAASLRAGRTEALDLAHLAEEVESMGVSERREIRNRLRILLLHLLKWECQPSHRSPSWRATVTEQRIGIESVLADSPSLVSFPETILDSCYRWAVKQAALETGLPETHFPPACPFTLKTVLDFNFWPGPSGPAVL